MGYLKASLGRLRFHNKSLGPHAIIFIFASRQNS